MNEKTLTIEEYGIKNQEKTGQLLDRLLMEDDLYLTVRFRFYRRKIDKKLLTEIAELIRERGRKKEFVIRLLLETDQWKAVKRLRKIMNQYGMGAELQAVPSLKSVTAAKLGKKMLLEDLILTGSDFDTLKKAYDTYKDTGVTMAVFHGDCEPDAEQYTEWFDEWVNDPNAGWVDLFLDAAAFAFMGIHMSDCTHDSCMGKNLYVDPEAEVFFCSQKKNGTKMETYINDAVYQDVLKKAVERRRSCKAECQWFSCCQGGCPLEEYRKESCMDYQKKMQHVWNYIEKHSENMFLDVPNPAFRQMFLNVAGFGFRM